MGKPEGGDFVAVKDEHVDRQKWTKSFDFLFATVGMSVGLGNVWRFPYLCFKNGGGAFLVPYFFFAVTIAIPVVILETSIGQKVRKGIVQSWATVPIFKGIAFAQTMVVFHSNVSYPIILVWALKYFVNSFQSTLPWSTCDNDWNTARCITPEGIGNKTWKNETLYPNGTVSSATEYWMREVLNVSSGIDKPGNMRWDLALYLLILWVWIYLCTFKGIKWSAKVIYVTATAPFLLIGIILVRGVTLEGAGDGLRYYLIPDIVRLSDIQVWIAAATQVLYSYATACGAIATLGSYNKYTHDFWRDSFLIAGFNSLASFASGIAVFSTLGFMANYQNTTVAEVASSGPGLAFIAYPQTLSLLPLPQFWCVVFFLMILFLGFDSEFVCQETMMGIIFDNFPIFRKRRELTQAVFCFLLMCIGLSMTTEGGVYVFEIYNNYGVAGWSMFFIVACEFVAIAWFYGFDRYWEEMKDMIGDRWGRTWIMVSWKFVGPTFCGLMALYYVAVHQPLTYQDYEYPGWAQGVAFLMSLSSVLMIPGFAVYKIFKTWMNGYSYDSGFVALQRKRMHFSPDKEMTDLSGESSSSPESNSLVEMQP